MASFDPVISVLYSTLDICLYHCVLQTDTPFSDHVLLCTCTNSKIQDPILHTLKSLGMRLPRPRIGRHDNINYIV